MKETKFKDTEVGRIPESWEATRIDKLCCLKARIGWQGLTTGEYLPQGDYVLVTGTDFNDGYIDWKNCCYVSKWRYDQDINIQIKEGDVLISKDGTIGKVAFLDSIPGPGTLNSGVFVVRPKQDNVINKAYLSWIFKSIWFKSFIDQLTAGSTINHLYQKDFVKFLLVYPNDISEQSRIATALSAIDNLIFELGKLIEKIRAIKQGAMQQLLTGKKRLKGFDKCKKYKQSEFGELPDDWRLVPIKELAKDMADGPFGSNLKTEHYTTDKQVRVIQLGNIGDNGWLDENTKYTTFEHAKTLSRCIVSPGCILVAKMMPAGRAIICPSEEKQYILGSDVVRIIPNESLIARYFMYQSKSELYLTQIFTNTQGSTRQRTSISKLRNILIPLPQTKNEQSAIAKVLSSMDEEISVLEAKREKYNTIKQGMMQQLLTGRIRLVETAVKPNATSANVYFRRSVLAAEIAERLYEEPTFGHVKMEKMLFLTERLCHIDIDSHYHRDAAGPYDNKALRSIDSQLKKQKWFEVQRTEKGYRYVPMQNCGKHKTYFNRYYSGVVPMFDKIINTFKTQNTERCEIVATLYSAWEDLLHSNKSFTDADIVDEVLNNWHESKKRISQDRWLKAIQWMRDNGFAPDMSVCMK